MKTVTMARLTSICLISLLTLASGCTSASRPQITIDVILEDSSIVLDDFIDYYLVISNASSQPIEVDVGGIKIEKTVFLRVGYVDLDARVREAINDPPGDRVFSTDDSSPRYELLYPQERLIIHIKSTLHTWASTTSGDVLEPTGPRAKLKGAAKIGYRMLNDGELVWSVVLSDVQSVAID